MPHARSQADLGAQCESLRQSGWWRSGRLSGPAFSMGLASGYPRTSGLRTRSLRSREVSDRLRAVRATRPR